MAGHSQFKNIMFRKGRQDKERSKLFSRLAREFSLHTEGRQRLSAAARYLRSDTPPRLEARLRRGLGELWRNSGAARRARDEY
ncbi:MAG TPA: hypothetical protein VMF67_13865 [Rhizomicrobium sp.]|nr:hypothetical protein [Rhizomicrobium sp.]